MDRIFRIIDPTESISLDQWSQLYIELPENQKEIVMKLEFLDFPSKLSVTKLIYYSMKKQEMDIFESSWIEWGWEVKGSPTTTEETPDSAPHNPNASIIEEIDLQEGEMAKNVLEESVVMEEDPNPIQSPVVSLSDPVDVTHEKLMASQMEQMDQAMDIEDVSDQTEKQQHDAKSEMDQIMSEKETDSNEMSIQNPITLSVQEQSAKDIVMDSEADIGLEPSQSLFEVATDVFCSDEESQRFQSEKFQVVQSILSQENESVVMESDYPEGTPDPSQVLPTNLESNLKEEARGEFVAQANDLMSVETVPFGEGVPSTVSEHVSNNQDNLIDLAQSIHEAPSAGTALLIPAAIDMSENDSDPTVGELPLSVHDNQSDTTIPHTQELGLDEDEQIDNESVDLTESGYTELDEFYLKLKTTFKQKDVQIEELRRRITSLESNLNPLDSSAIGSLENQLQREVETRISLQHLVTHLKTQLLNVKQSSRVLQGQYTELEEKLQDMDELQFQLKQAKHQVRSVNHEKNLEMELKSLQMVTIQEREARLQEKCTALEIEVVNKQNEIQRLLPLETEILTAREQLSAMASQIDSNVSAKINELQALLDGKDLELETARRASIAVAALENRNGELEAVLQIRDKEIEELKIKLEQVSLHVQQQQMPLDSNELQKWKENCEQLEIDNQTLSQAKIGLENEFAEFKSIVSRDHQSLHDEMNKLQEELRQRSESNIQNDQQIKILNDELNLTKIELSNQLGKNQSYVEEISQLKNANSEMESQLNSLVEKSTHTDLLQQQFGVLKAELDTLKSNPQTSKLDEEMEELKKLVMYHEKQTQELKEMVSFNDQEMETMNAQLQQAEQDKINLKSELDLAVPKVELLQKECDELREHLKVYEATKLELLNAQSELQKTTVEFEHREMELKSELEQLRIKLQSLEQTETKTNQFVQELQGKNASLQEELSTIRETLLKSQSQESVLQQEINRLQNKSDNTSSKLKQLESIVTQEQELSESQKKMIEQLEGKIEGKNSEISTLQSRLQQLDIAESRIKELSQIEAELNSKLIEIQDELDVSKQAIESLEQHINEVSAERDQLLRKASQLEEEHDLLKTTLDFNKAEHDEMQRKYQKNKSAVEGYEKKISSLEKQLKQQASQQQTLALLDQEIKELAGTKEQLTEKIEKLEQEIQTLGKAKQDAQQQNTALARELVLQKQSNTKLNEQLAKLQMENSKLEKPEVVASTITTSAPARKKKAAVKLNVISEDQQADEVSTDLVPSGSSAPAVVEKKSKKRRESIRLDALHDADENSNPSKVHLM
jgi:chromosome segregation ATPase